MPDRIHLGVSAELARIAASVEALGDESTPQALLEGAAREFRMLLGATGCAISRRDDEVLRDVARSWASGYERSAAFAGYGYLLDDYPLTRAVINSGQSLSLSLDDDVIEPAEAFVLRELAMHSVVMVPLRVANRPWGLVEVWAAHPRRFTEGEVALAGLFARQVTHLFAQLETVESVERLYRETLASLVNALEAKDSYTSEHTQQVVDLAVAVASRLGLEADALRMVELGALLHDIGKIRVPESILNKPGPLDEDEWAVMRRHTVAGEAILAPITALANALPIVRGSHERWDGRGYPDGLEAEQIPLGARIVSVCDAYRAMLEPRPYRAPLSHEVAVAELRKHAGTQFDPACVEALLAGTRERGGQTSPPLHRPGSVNGDGYAAAATSR